MRARDQIYTRSSRDRESRQTEEAGTLPHAQSQIRSAGAALRGRSGMAGIISGLAGALLVVALGAAYVSQQPVQYSAYSQLLLAPESTLDPVASSSYWDTLGNGQLPATAAAIVEDKRIVNAATVNLDTATRDAVSTTVSVVPSTAVINVQVRAPTAAVAEDVANEISNLSTTQVTKVLAPYRFQVINDAKGTATLTSLSRAQWAGLVGLLALFVGLGIQQLLRGRARLVERREAARAVLPR